mmetsp:Transcript_2349/g.3858  ORF Transcript_2349/g.3858 Transcript_2349/m.3858 type:complete len:370 (+) Transcript_2349:229-1338(+)
MNDANATTAPTMTAAPSGNNIGDENPFDEEVMWIILWVFSLLLFLCLPFCITEPRRKLCLRRIRERRWISDDTVDDWYVSAMRQQQQQRRQQLDEQQRRFQTTRTQEDEIREQYLLFQMEKYTMCLSESDIHEVDEDRSLRRSGSQRSFGSQRSMGSRKKAISRSESSHCDQTVIDMDIEAQSDNHPVKEQRSGSLSEESEEAGEVLVFDFEDSNQKVYVPLPGQTNSDAGENEGRPSTRRLVSSGCAICLSLFDPEEKITWSANPECPHIFHSDCVLHWFLAVGRKVQKRRRRQNPDMTDEEALDTICKFPTLCPCCRQDFCLEVNIEDTTDSTLATEHSSGEEERHEEGGDVEAGGDHEQEIQNETS